MKNRSRSNLAPVILISLGIIFLLNNFGYLPWSIWLSIWKFWPILLILIGAELLFGRSASFRTVLILLLLIFVAPILLFLNPFGGNPLANKKIIIAEPLGTLVKSKLTIDVASLNLKLQATASDSAKLADGQISYTSVGGQTFFSSNQDKNSSFLAINEKSSGNIPFLSSIKNDIKLSLSDLIPEELRIKAAAANLDLNLTRLKISDLSVELGAGTIKIKYGATHSFKTRLKTGAGAITLEIPKTVGARIKISGGPKNLNLPKNRFDKSADLYQDKNFLSFSTRIDIEIEAAASSITVR